jgi:hypothetical protein
LSWSVVASCCGWHAVEEGAAAGAVAALVVEDVCAAVGVGWAVFPRSCPFALPFGVFGWG